MTKNGRFLTVHSKAEIFKRGSVRAVYFYEISRKVTKMKIRLQKNAAVYVKKALKKYLESEACATSSIAAYEHEMPRELKKYKPGNLKCAKS